MNLTIGVDASRNRSGGAKAHIIGLLNEGNPREHGINKIHLWSYPELLDLVRDKPWLEKHSPASLTKSLPEQLWWQRFVLPKLAKKAGCNLLFNTDAGTVCRFSPSVTLSQDLLSYEGGAMQRFGFTRSRLRLLALYYMQNRSLSKSDGVIFLSNYAEVTIRRAAGRLPRSQIIPHGIDAAFKAVQWRASTKPGGPFHCVYVSNAEMYKHQWVVVRALSRLRSQGLDVRLTLAGGGRGRAMRLLKEAMAECDPNGRFVQCLSFLPHSELPALLAGSDLFIFASSCENLPVTLLEAMAVGMPIASSNRGPMAEVLEDASVYFDPEDEESIASAVKSLIIDEPRRLTAGRRARELSEKYSWSRCADKTWAYLSEIANSRKER